MTSLIFFDTEFTDFAINDEPRLISIGLVDQAGNEFYAELIDTYQFSDCSGFVCENVLPLLVGGDARMTWAQLADRLNRWVLERGDDVIFRCDSPFYDWAFIQQLFSEFDNWPENLRRNCGDMSYESNTHGLRYRAAVNEFWKIHGKLQHHALVDARMLLFAFKKAIRRGI